MPKTWEELCVWARAEWPQYAFMEDVELICLVADELVSLNRLPDEERTEHELQMLRVLPTVLEFMS